MNIKSNSIFKTMLPLVCISGAYVISYLASLGIGLYELIFQCFLSQDVRWEISPYSWGFPCTNESLMGIVFNILFAIATFSIVQLIKLRYIIETLSIVLLVTLGFISFNNILDSCIVTTSISCFLFFMITLGVFHSTVLEFRHRNLTYIIFCLTLVFFTSCQLFIGVSMISVHANFTFSVIVFLASIICISITFYCSTASLNMSKIDLTTSGGRESSARMFRSPQGEQSLGSG